MNDLQRTCRWLAILAVAGLLLSQSTGLTLGLAFFWSLLFVVVFTAAVFAAVFLLAPDGWRHIERHPDLLVPLALLAGALGLLDWLSSGTARLGTELFTVPLGFVQIPVSVAWVVKILLHALFATWMTLMVVEVVRRDRVDLAATLRQSKRRYLPLLTLLCLGWSATALLYAVEMPVMLMLGMGAVGALGRAGIVAVWMLLAGVLAYRFAFSLATAAILPIAVQSDGSVWATLRRGIAESWRNRGKWWKLMLAQFLVTGAWAMVAFQYKHQSSPFRTNTNLNVNFRYCAPWLADYDYDSQWYTEVMRWLDREPLILVATLCSLLTGLLSIAVKLTIVERLAAVKTQSASDPMVRDEEEPSEPEETQA